MERRFKIFGERNSGTNLLRILLSDQPLLPDDAGLTPSTLLNRVALIAGRLSPETYDRVYDRFTQNRHRGICGWKHAAPSESLLRQAGVTPVVIVKHPSFWMRSFHRRPFHHAGASSLYRPRRIENLPREELHLEEMLLLKMESYRQVLTAYGGVLVQYETLVSHFEESRQRIISLVGACRPLPEGDVRGFVHDDEAGGEYAARYSGDALRELEVFSDTRLRVSSELLSFFGYGSREWYKTLPRSS